MLGVTHMWQSRVNPMKLTYLPTGQSILFRGVDDATKLKSLKVSSGYAFWIGGEPEHTQKEVAERLGIFQSYISRLEKRIIARLKREILKVMEVQ